ncbi:chymotrypsin-1 [Drosophila innubila]|uniref:chymotrypsin-1 n=1 Tax=Drosophila innubila TaxID=198719 RepID=UPI00148CB790|nr:chymotrypsin-1 [Drosophila innubila]
MIAQRMTLSLLCLAVALGLVVASPQGRLLGSEDAEMSKYPWVASLRLNKAHVCQANIISQTQMITAAHCVSDLGTQPVPASQLTARVGSINQFAAGLLVDIKEVKIHPSYGNFLHDVAILTLSQPLTFTEKINKIALPEKPEGGDELPELPANGTPVYVTGWGEQLDGSSKYNLQKANFNTLSKSNCELAAGYGYDSVLCLSSAEKQGVCRGDDGASVVDDNGVMVGIVSFFFGNCGTKYPDVSTRISYYRDWIDANQQ